MTSADRGSIFIEALVASAILSLSLLTMLQAFHGTALRERTLADRRLAVLVAQSELAAVGSEIPPAPGTSNGTDGPYAWTVAIAPAAGDDQVTLLDVRVSVRLDGSSRELASLHTLRVAQ